MAQNFNLILDNPSITKSPKDIVYTGLAGGNQLNLVLTNNSGFSFTFAYGTGNNLLVNISAEILDATSAAAITVAAPWVTDGIIPPVPVTDNALNALPQYYGIKLKMNEPAGLNFPNSSSVTVVLSTLAPTATGSAAVTATYDFGSLTMNVASQVTVLSSSNTGNTLIGENQYLLYTRQINDGDELNSIVATAPDKEVNEADAAENTIHVSLFFLNPASNTNGQGTMGGLVPSWDASRPPTFKLRFPYFDGDSPDPAYADLTDDFGISDPSYNAYTSAWNVKLSLDRDDPNILTNTWWTIIPPSLNSPSPYWLIQPTNNNTHLFTGLSTGPQASGPFLDLYFSHIYTKLPVSTNNPATQIILETYQFPGFNDAAWPRPLLKEHAVEILSFGGQVHSSPSAGMVLLLNWQTKNADHCFLEGNASQLAASTSGTGYSLPISNSQPLASSYTLIAYDKQQVSKISQTINVQWKADDARVFPVSDSLGTPTALAISPAAGSVYVAGGLPDNVNVGVAVLNGQTLVASSTPVILPHEYVAQNVVATPDGTKIMIAGLAKDGSKGTVYGYQTSAPPTPTLGTPVELDPCLLPNLYPMAVSDDSAQLLLLAPYASPAAPYIAGIRTSPLAIFPASSNPQPIKGLRTIGLATYGDNLFYPDGSPDGGLGILSRTTLAAVAGSPISLRSDTSGVNYTAGPILVSQDGKTITTLAQGYTKELQRVFILCQVDVPTKTLARRIQVYNGYGTGAPTPMTNLAYSIDEKYIFVFGLDYRPNATNGESLLSVYDARSLQETPWSPIATPLSDNKLKSFLVDMKMAPDGSRIYALTLESTTSAISLGRVRAFIPYLQS